MEKIVILFAVAVSCANAYAVDVDSQSIGFDRITNGNFAADTKFPFAVSIQQQAQVLTSNTRGHRCGGVLITPQHVLTLATCTNDTVNGINTPINPAAYRVFAGSDILTNDASPDRVRPIANYTVHPEYLGAPSLLNDIAIITLSSPFPKSTVVPIAIPAANFTPADFTVCTIAGWGALLIGTNASTELRYASKYIYNQQLCTSLYSSIFGVANIFPSMICAASYDILSSGCAGDEGNALVCNGQLTGLLSLTNNCQASSYPEIYTRVSNYSIWIRRVINGASSYKPEFAILALFTLVQIVKIHV